MAEILTFPAETTANTQETGTPLPHRPDGVPDAVWHAVCSVHAMRRVGGVRYREIPVPSTLADYGIGVQMECGAVEGRDGLSAPHDEASKHSAGGWVMLLYSERPRSDWQGHWRCVVFARLPLEPNENDGLTPAMYWEDMCAYLTDPDPDSVTGTVTVTQNTSFGSLEGDTSAGCEIRASFTPLPMATSPGGDIDAGELVATWGEFLASTVGDDDRSYRE